MSVKTATTTTTTATASASTSTSATTTKIERPHDLFTWLKHIKEHHHHHHSSKNATTTTTTTTETSQQQNDKKEEYLPTIISEDDSNIDSSSQESGSRRPSRIFPPPPPHIHFHRPHGLLEKFHNSHCKHLKHKNNASNDNINEQQPSAISTNDADAERENNLTLPVAAATKFPPYLTDKFIDSSASINSFSSYGSGHSREGGQRESSILPSDLDSPEIGYKKLKEDGNLVDYDDISVLAEIEQYGNDKVAEVQAHSRSVIRNDLIRLAINGPFQSPMATTKEKKQVLHVGCGNGNWGVDMATLFPHWLIIGMDDKSGGAVQDQRKVPRNFKYIRCYFDLLTTLNDIPDNSFDLVFARFLIYSYNEKSYKQLIKQCERICKPGGYVEFYELDMRIYGNPKAGPMTHKLNAKVFRVMESRRLNPRMARKLGDMVYDTFHAHDNASLDPDSSDQQQPKPNKKNKQEFDTNYTSLPLGVWGGRLGVMFRDDMNDLYEFFKINRDELDSDDIRQDDTPPPEEENRYKEMVDAPTFCKAMETMDEEMETQKAFMNLHHVYARKCSSCLDDKEQ